MLAQATFSNFSYEGQDQRFAKQIDNTREYFNPILAGFYPDPSICRKGDTFYLVNSTFAFFPGVPIFESRDLVNWRQIGSVLDRESQVPLRGQGVSGGIFAPDISYNSANDTFYMITTNVGAGNFYVKSKDPSQGWSEPVYLPAIDGIDPSFCFDDDGRAYIVHNAPVYGEADYEGQRAIRLLEFDVANDSVIGQPTEIVRGGTHVDEQPIWIEGPHLYHIGDYYYLMCAEGGTGTWHSEVVFRADSPLGPWEENPGNPILTQRTGLDPNRPDCVSSTGHADLVQSPDGSWWAVFLGCRPYEDDCYNTGRETFLLPVTWEDDWPEILPKDTPVPTVVKKSPWQASFFRPQNARLNPSLSMSDTHIPALTGNLKFADDFSSATLNPRWMFLRNPSDFYSLTPSGIVMTPKAVAISERESPSAIFYRQQNTSFQVEVTLTFSPTKESELAGVVLLQNEEYNLVLGKTIVDGTPALVLTRSEKTTETIATVPLRAEEQAAPLRLRITGNGRYCDFHYSVPSPTGETAWKEIARNVDVANLSTNRSGGFVGNCIGLYATACASRL